MTLSPEQAYARLADRCATAEMCAHEALSKLQQWDVPYNLAIKIVQRLINERFIDDERFAAIWVRDRIQNAHWGIIKIRQSLQQKNIDSDIIHKAISQNVNEELYFRNLAAALRSKARALSNPLTYTDKLKLARFAIGRGYEPDLVQDMIADEDYWRNDNE